MEQSNGTSCFDEMLQQIIAQEGLPPELQTEAHLWDEIMKKLIVTVPEQVFPLLKEVFGRKYPPGTTICPLATEYSVDREKTKEISSVRADITIQVGEEDTYHFELQINRDGTMALRMFEYGIHLAISYARLTSDGTYLIRFPNSVVLYLQSRKKIPEQLQCELLLPDGTLYTYQIPTLGVQSFSLEEIHQKHLNILIPFLPLQFRRIIYRNDNKNIAQAATKKLRNFYHEVIIILEDEVKNGYLTECQKKIILELFCKALIRVSVPNHAVLKEMVTMTAPILKLACEVEEELKQKILEQSASLAEKDASLAEKDAFIAEKDASLAEKDAYIAEKDASLAEKDAFIAEKDASLAEKDAQIARLKELLYMK